MSPLNSKETYKSFSKKGFRDAVNKSKDHIRVEFWYEGKLTRSRTKFSHNGKELNDYLIREMSKQIYLTKKEFVAFAKCILSEKEYIKILNKQGVI